MATKKMIRTTMIKPSCIGIGGVSRSGKDTLFRCFQAIFDSYNLKCQRFALADELKVDLNEFLKKNVGISAFTLDPTEKEIIRDIMVAYGKAKRIQTNGTYWTNLLTPKIQNYIKDGGIAIITDIRYDYYPRDEVYWVKNVLKAPLVHVTRTFNGDFIKPANTEEERNDPKIKAKADYLLCWPTDSKLDNLIDFVYVQLDELLKVNDHGD